MRQVDFCVSLYTILTERDETKRIVIERESYSTRHSDAGNGRGAAFSQVCWIELLSPSAAGRWDVKKKTCRSPTGPLLQAGHRWQWTNDSVWASSTITAGSLIEWLDGMRADPARHITWEREKSTLTDRRRRTCVYTCRTLLLPTSPSHPRWTSFPFPDLSYPIHTHTHFFHMGRTSAHLFEYDPPFSPFARISHSPRFRLCWPCPCGGPLSFLQPSSLSLSRAVPPPPSLHATGI